MLASDADPANITLVEQEFDGVLDDTMDVAEGVVFFHPAFINGTGVGSFPDDYNVFAPAENGADFASQTIAATDDYIASNSDTITCFLRASIRGWQDTFTDPAAAVADTMIFVPPGAIPEPHQQAAISDVLPIVGTGATDATLLMPTPDEYQTTLDALVEVGYLDEVPPVDETFDSGPYDAMGPIPVSSAAAASSSP
jgi:NitT/TauT family transport system substrate-binding protein